MAIVDYLSALKVGEARYQEAAQDTEKLKKLASKYNLRISVNGHQIGEISGWEPSTRMLSQERVLKVPRRSRYDIIIDPEMPDLSVPEVVIRTFSKPAPTKPTSGGRPVF